MQRLLVFAVLLGCASPALAHGPTVEIGSEGPAPAALQIESGETVHFQNATDHPLRVLGEEGSFRSPELAPGEGWHLRFAFPGRFPYALEDRPDVSGEIAVGEPASSP